jgi:hypothetical protein
MLYSVSIKTNFCAALFLSCVSGSLCHYFTCAEGRFELLIRVIIRTKTIFAIPSSSRGKATLQS